MLVARSLCPPTVQMKVLLCLSSLLILQARGNYYPHTAHRCTQEWSSGHSYIEFDFVHATSILSIRVEDPPSPEKCIRDETYGFLDTTVWVDPGCHALIHVCFMVSNEPIPPRTPFVQAEVGHAATYGGTYFPPAGQQAVAEPNGATSATAAALAAAEAANSAAAAATLAAQAIAAVVAAAGNGGLNTLLQAASPRVAVDEASPPIRRRRNLHSRHCVKERTSGTTRVKFQPAKAVTILSVDVVDAEKNKYGCQQGQGYGVIESFVWVDINCKATFNICFHVEHIHRFVHF